MSDEPRSDGSQVGDWTVHVVQIGKWWQWWAKSPTSVSYGELHYTEEAAREAAMRQLKGEHP